jgi:hypothetical protein
MILTTLYLAGAKNTDKRMMMEQERERERERERESGMKRS